jgi:hypothetical protein
MATGPEHYKEAEEFLKLAKSEKYGSDQESYHLRAAQVHATLALAAATALTHDSPYWVDATEREGSGWEKVAS